MSDAEYSPGGSEILRHEHVDRGFTPGRPAPNVEEVEAHISRVVGEPATVFHEIASDLIHLDVNIVRPAGNRNWWTLFTTGMSALPMNVPEGHDHLRFAELVLKLPPSWRIDEMRTTPPPGDLEAMYWPIGGLKQLARLPHDYDTWLASGHTIPNGDPPVPFSDGTALCAWLILPLPGVPADQQSSRLSDGSVLNLYAVRRAPSGRARAEAEPGDGSPARCLRPSERERGPRSAASVERRRTAEAPLAGSLRSWVAGLTRRR